MIRAPAFERQQKHQKEKQKNETTTATVMKEDERLLLPLTHVFVSLHITDSVLTVFFACKFVAGIVSGA